MIDFGAINAALLHRARDLVPQWLPNGKVRGREWLTGDLHGKAGDSLSVNLETGKWADFATGEKGGDLVSLFAAITGKTQADAARELTSQQGITMAQVGAQRPQEQRSRPHYSKPPAGTPAPQVQADHVYPYLDADGSLLKMICRIDEKPGFKKSFFPLSWDRDKGEWVRKEWPENRPLYGLDLLKKCPAAPVLLVEGEKSAEAARKLVGDRYIVITWSGGSQAHNKTDWTPLAGRSVTIWPDADEAGRKAAYAIAKHLTFLGCKVVSIVGVSDLGEGWDAADAQVEGWSAEKTFQWIRERSKPYEPPKTETPTQKIVVLPSVGPKGEVITVPIAAASVFSVLRDSKQFFVRGGRIHEAREGEYGATLVPLTVSEFIARLPNYCDLFSWRIMDGNTVLKPCVRLAEDTAKPLMASTEALRILPPVASVVRFPGLVERDGRLESMRPGYNPEQGGALVVGDLSIPEIDVQHSWVILRELIADFDFQTPADQSRALAAFITPALRLAGLITGHVPILIVEADKSQTGKTFLSSLIAMVYGETLAVITQKTGGVGSLDESVSQRLIDGRPFILFDNTRGKIDSILLESLLTSCGGYKARVPRLGEVEVNPKRFLFSLTSNGVEITKDLANRACIVRIKKRPTGYQFRKWTLSNGRSGDVQDHIKDRQGEILGAVHAICRHWYNEGRNETEEARHSFRQWARALDWIVRAAGEAPLMDGHSEIQERVADAGLVWLRSMALELARIPGAASWSASRLAEAATERGIPIPNCRADADELGQAKSIGVLMRRLLTDGPLDLDGVIVSKTEVWDTNQGRNRNEYRFESPSLQLSKGKTTQENPPISPVLTTPWRLGGTEEEGRDSDAAEIDNLVMRADAGDESARLELADRLCRKAGTP